MKLTIWDFIRGRNPLESNAQLRKELTELKEHVIVLQQSVIQQGKRIIAMERDRVGGAT